MKRATNAVPFDLPTDTEVSTKMRAVGIKHMRLPLVSTKNDEVAPKIGTLDDFARREILTPSDGIPPKRNAERKTTHREILPDRRPQIGPGPSRPAKIQSIMGRCCRP